MLADYWAQRPRSVYGRGHPDQPDAAGGVQAAVAADRGPDDVRTIVDGLDDFNAGSHHGQPSRGDVGGYPGYVSAASPLQILIDSTGLQVYGAGQWLEAKHGAKSRRKWRKLHLAVDAAAA
jgi:hypothetical protein